MFQNSPLLEMTVEQAATVLAKRACEVRAGQVEKRAAMPAWLSGLGQHVSNAWSGLGPAAQGGIAGAGLGGLVGLGTSVIGDDERSPLSSTLTGALAGGALGTGAGLAYKHWGEVGKPSPLDEIRKRRAQLVEDAKPGPVAAAGRAIAQAGGKALSNPYVAGTAGTVAAWEAGKLYRRMGTGVQNIADPEVFRNGLNRMPELAGLNRGALGELAKAAPEYRNTIFEAIRTGKTDPTKARSWIASLTDPAQQAAAEEMLQKAMAQREYGGITAQNLNKVMGSGLAEMGNLPKGEAASWWNTRPTFFTREPLTGRSTWKPNLKGFMPWAEQESVGYMKPSIGLKGRAIGKLGIPAAVAGYIFAKNYANQQSAAQQELSQFDQQHLPEVQQYLHDAASQQAK